MDISNEHRLTEVEERSKANQRRIDNLEKRQSNLEELTGTVKALAIKEENVEKMVTDIKDDVRELTNKPAKRWEGVVDKVIFTIIGAIVGYIMVKLGLGV